MRAHTLLIIASIVLAGCSQGVILPIAPDHQAKTDGEARCLANMTIYDRWLRRVGLKIRIIEVIRATALDFDLEVASDCSQKGDDYSW